MRQLMRRSVAQLVGALTMILLASSLLATPASASGGVTLSTILTGYARPVLVTAPRGSGHRIFIVDQTGTIEVATRSHG